MEKKKDSKVAAVDCLTDWTASPPVPYSVVLAVDDALKRKGVGQGPRVLCKDCKWASDPTYNFGRCKYPNARGYDATPLQDGDERGESPYLSRERAEGGGCGPWGKRFEPKTLASRGVNPLWFLLFLVVGAFIMLMGRMKGAG